MRSASLRAWSLSVTARLLRGHERRSQQALELAEAHEIVLELFDLVREIGALAPDVFVAGGDLVEQVVDRRFLVTADEAFSGFDVSDLDGSECHESPPFSAAG